MKVNNITHRIVLLCIFNRRFRAAICSHHTIPFPKVIYQFPKKGKSSSKSKRKQSDLSKEDLEDDVRSVISLESGISETPPPEELQNPNFLMKMQICFGIATEATTSTVNRFHSACWGSRENSGVLRVSGRVARQSCIGLTMLCKDARRVVHNRCGRRFSRGGRQELSGGLIVMEESPKKTTAKGTNY